MIELLAGLTVGLLVIAAAIGSLALSRAMAGTVSEISHLQRQGAFALRVIGMQLRQAGSVEPVLDDATRLYAFGAEFPTFGTTVGSISGAEGGNAPDSVSVASFPPRLLAPGALSGPPEVHDDCIGNEVASRMEATFTLDAGGQLMCRAGKTQPVIHNVTDFQVAYRVDTSGGRQIMNADRVEAAKLWGAVTAIEICMALRGTERWPDAGAIYMDCSGLPRPRDGYTNLVFRNVFNVRVQGR